MKYVYFLQSTRYSNQRHIGLTWDPDERLKEHNAGKSPHTSKFVPWRLIAAIRFEKESRAAAFEPYLKSCVALSPNGIPARWCGTGEAIAQRTLCGFKGQRGDRQ